MVLVPVLLAVLFVFGPRLGPAHCDFRAGMVALHEVLWSTGFVKTRRSPGLAIVLAGLIPFWVFVGGVCSRRW